MHDGHVIDKQAARWPLGPICEMHEWPVNGLSLSI